MPEVDLDKDVGGYAKVKTRLKSEILDILANKNEQNDPEAIKRIEEGNYGICEDCLKPISEKRLQVAPAATLCIECKAEEEKRQRVENIRRINSHHGVQIGEPPGGN